MKLFKQLSQSFGLPQAVLAYIFFVLLSLLVLPQNSYALNCNDQGVGDWNVVGTWDCGVVPDSDDNVTIDSHTVTMTGDETVDAVIVSAGGTLIIGANTLSVSGDWTGTGGTINADASTVRFTGGGATSVVTGGVGNNNDFNNVILDKTSVLDDFDLTVDNMDIDGNLTLMRGQLDLQAVDIELAADFIITSTSIARELGSGLIVFDGTGLQTIFNPGGETDAALSIRVTNTSGAGVVLNDSVVFGSEFILAANANFNAAGNDFSVNDSFDPSVWTVAATASFTSGANTVSFIGLDDSTIDTGGTDANHDFNNVVFAKSTAADDLILVNNDMNVDGDMTFQGGQFNPQGVDLLLAGDIDLTSTGIQAELGSGQIVFDGAGLQTISNSGGETQAAFAIHVTNTSLAGVVLNDAITFGTEFILDVNTNFDAQGNDMVIGNPVNGVSWNVAASAAFTSGANTVSFVGGNDMSIITGGADDNHDFNNVVFNSGNVLDDFDITVNDMDIDGNLTFSRGRLDLQGVNITLAGNLSITSTGISAEVGNGDIVFDGSSLQTFGNPGAETAAIAEVQISNAIGVRIDNDVTVTDMLINAGGVLDTNGNDLTVNTNFNNNGTLQLEGDETLTQPTNGIPSVVEYTATAGSRNIQNWIYDSLRINGTGGSFTMGNAEVLTDALRVSAGTFDLNGQTLSVNGSTLIDGGLLRTGTNVFTLGDAGADSITISSGELRIESDNLATDIVVNAGSWTNSGGTITFAGTGTTLPTYISGYHNLAIDAAGQVFSLPNFAVIANGVLNVSNGTLNFDNDRNFSVNDTDATGTAVTVAGAGTLNNLGTGDFILGGNVSNAGTINFNSSSADDIVIDSTNATPRSWVNTGTLTMEDVSVQDMSASATVIVTSGTNLGNNSNWIFPVGTLNNAAVTPLTLTESLATNVSINFTPGNDILPDGRIRITFPTGFNVSGASGAASLSDLDGGFSTTVSGQQVTITRDGAGSLFASGNLIDDLTISGVQNPAAGTTGSFTIEILTSGNTLIDTGTAPSVTITTATGGLTVSVISGSSGLPGVSIGGTLGARVTDANGQVSFGVLPNGTSYTLTPALTGFTFSPSSVTATFNGNTIVSFVATVDPTATYSISGVVRVDNLAADPLADVIVSDGTRETTTDENGTFIIHSVPAGTYTLSGAKGNFRISSDTETTPLTVSTANITNQVLTADKSLVGSAYVFWNTFLNLTNVLELRNIGTSSINVTITVFNAAGATLDSLNTTVAANQPLDVFVNGLSGVNANDYGLLRIDTSADTLTGQLVRYRIEGAQIALGLSSAIKSSLTGSSFVQYNTFPVMSGVVSLQWLSISNIDSVSQTFTINRYDASGSLLQSQQVLVAPLGRVDLEAGHLLPGVNQIGLIEVIPPTLSTPYLAELNRVGHMSGNLDGDVPYAASFPAEPAHGRELTTFISNLAPQPITYIELANPATTTSTYQIEAFDSVGTNTFSDTLLVAPRAVRHLDAGELLGTGNVGVVKIEALGAGTTSAYRSDYYSNPLATITTSIPLTESIGNTSSGSYNVFRNSFNWIRLSNISNVATVTQLSVYDFFGVQVHTESFTLFPGTRLDYGLHERSELEQSSVLFGYFLISHTANGRVVSEVIRDIPGTDNTRTYIFPTTVQ